jgi:hypothetical protein
MTEPDSTRSRVAYALLLGSPAWALGVAGFFHPQSLTYESSWRWFALHIPGMVAFPLVGVALALLVARRTDAVAWAVRLAAYVYAVFYTALDVVSGVAAGWVTHELGPGVPRPDEVRLLFRLGTPLGEVGSIALIIACALLTVDLLRRCGTSAWPVLALVPGALLVHVDHIFLVGGVAGMFLLATGTAGTAFSARHATDRVPAAS